MINEAKQEVDHLIRLTRSFVLHKLVPWPDFLGAMIVGSVAHGEARPDSDVDCVFVFDKVDERIVPAEFVWQPDFDTVYTIFEVEAASVGGVQIDATDRRVSLKQFAEAEWAEGSKHEFSKAILLFDRDGAIEALLTKKLQYHDSLRSTRIANHISRVEYHLELWRLQSWIERGGLPCAHDQLTVALEELLQLLHACNSEWLPWRYRWLVSAQKLSWLPTDFAGHIHNALATGSLTEDDLIHRYKALVQVLLSIEQRLQDDGLLRASAGAFASKHQDLGYAHNMDTWRAAHEELLRRA